MLSRCRWWVPVGLAIALGACNQPAAETGPAPEAAASAPAATPAPTAPTESEPSAPVASDTLAAGQYCYEAATDTLSAAVRLTVAADGALSGDSAASIHDEANGYFTSYRQALSGTLTGDQADLDITTWIEYDQQQVSEIWTMDAEDLNDGFTDYASLDCRAVQDYFAGPDGLEAADLLSDVNIATNQRVQFEPGTSSAFLSNSVVRGDRDLYLLGAQGGQTMVVSISALEDNAAFAIVSPAGDILVLEGVDEELFLPHTGDYQVIVGGTRGNASYDLFIAIE
jgi:hypothetical protein